MDRIKQALLVPLGPTFPLIMGTFSIVWGLWLFIPKSELIASVYAFIRVSWMHYGTASLAIFCGLCLLYLFFRDKAVAAFSSALAWLGIIYTFVAITIALNDWTNNTWLLYALLAFYCLFGAANYIMGEEFYRIKLRR